MIKLLVRLANARTRRQMKTLRGKEKTIECLLKSLGDACAANQQAMIIISGLNMQVIQLKLENAQYREYFDDIEDRVIQ